MNVRSKLKLSHAASNFVKYSFLWSPWANFSAVKSGMVRVASTSLFLYKSNVTPAAFVRNKTESNTASAIKMYGENCMIAAIVSLDVWCTFLFIISLPSSSTSFTLWVLVLLRVCCIGSKFLHFTYRVGFAVDEIKHKMFTTSNQQIVTKKQKINRKETQV